MSGYDWSVCDVSQSSHCNNMAQWWLDLAHCNLKHYSAPLLAMVTVTLDFRGAEWWKNEGRGGNIRVHNLVMSAGILTSFDDLVRRREGGAVFSPLSMTPFQSSTHAFLCLYSPWQREREEKELSVFNLEGSQMCEILYAIWVRVCLTGWRTTHKKTFCARLSVTWSDQRVIACMVFILQALWHKS